MTAARKRGPGRPPLPDALDASVRIDVRREDLERWREVARERGTTLAAEARRAWERMARRAVRDDR